MRVTGFFVIALAGFLAGGISLSAVVLVATGMVGTALLLSGE